MPTESGPHVLHISHGYYPEVGGIQRQLAMVCPRLLDRGLGVEVLTRSLSGEPGTQEIGGVPVHRIKAEETGFASSIRFTWGGLRRLSSLEPRPSLVHSHELLSTTSLALWAKRRWDVPIVAEPHARGREGDLSRLLRKPLGRWRLSDIVNHVDCFIAISSSISSELVELGVEESKIVRLANAVDSHRFAPAGGPSEIARLRAELGLPAGGPIAVFVGRLEHVKGVDVLVEAWSEVRLRLPRATLLVFGSGSLAQIFDEEGLESTGLDYRGPVDNVLPYLQAADAFVLPSRSEGLPLALLEAMAVGLPCIASDVGGSAELIDDRRSGILVPAGHVGELVEAISTILGDLETWHHLGHAARQAVMMSYDLEVKTDGLVAIYRALLDS